MSRESPSLIKVKKEVDKRVVNVGQKVQVTISVNNVGNTAAYDVEIEEVIPRGLELVGAAEKIAKVNVIEPRGSYIQSYDVTSKSARRYRLPKATATYHKRGGLFKGRSYHAKSTRNPSISFVDTEINCIPNAITFLTTFKNPARTSLRVSETVEVTNKEGETVQTIKREPVTVKSNAEHVFKDIWTVPEGLERGIYRARSTIIYEINDEKREIGKGKTFSI